MISDIAIKDIIILAQFQELIADDPEMGPLGRAIEITCFVLSQMDDNRRVLVGQDKDNLKELVILPPSRNKY